MTTGHIKETSAGSPGHEKKPFWIICKRGGPADYSTGESRQKPEPVGTTRKERNKMNQPERGDLRSNPNSATDWILCVPG